MKALSILIKSNSSDGVIIKAETDVKLVCETIFALISISNKYPILLDLLFGQEAKKRIVSHSLFRINYSSVYFNPPVETGDSLLILLNSSKNSCGSTTSISLNK